MNYLICHKDYELRVSGSCGGAEAATKSLARFLRALGETVFVAGQLDRPELEIMGVPYWDLGPGFDTQRALERAAALGDFVLISAGKAQPLVQAGNIRQCRARILITHDRAGGDSGLRAPVLSKNCDAIICVSNASRDVMIEAGANPKKCVVINNGVDLDLYKPSDPNIRNWRKLVFSGALIQDKGIHFLLQAYATLLSKYPDLSLDVFGTSKLWGREPFFDQEQVAKQLPGVTFHGDVEQERLADAYSRAGLLVYPSIWFEPFGMTATDALATGCPVVMFDVGGPRDIVLDGKNGALINEVSIEALTARLDQMLSNPAKLHEMSEWILRYDRGRFDWNKTAKAVRELSVRIIESKSEISKSLRPSSATKGNLGILSTWNQTCGLATYAQFLCSELEQGTFSVLAEQAAAIAADQNFVERCWKRGTADYGKLLAAIERKKIKHLLINGHYRFFPQPAFRDFLFTLKQRGIDTSIILHNPFTIDAGLKALVEGAAMVFVHTPENRLEVIANGADAAKVKVLQHGVKIAPKLVPQQHEAFRSKFGIPSQDPLLVSFGFIQPHKGMEALIESIAYLRKSSVPAFGLIAGQVMPDDPNSASYLSALQDLSERAGTANYLRIPNRFFDEAEVQEALQCADLVVMNYHSQHYEASGACSLAVGADAIVLASIAPPFAAFGDAVWHITKGYPCHLSAALLLSDNKLRSEVKANARAYALKYSWNNIAKQLLSHLGSLGFAPAVFSASNEVRSHAAFKLAEPPNWEKCAAWFFSPPNPQPAQNGSQAPLPTMLQTERR